jgi:hypothetical protein
MPDLLSELTKCPKWKSTRLYDRCRAIYDHQDGCSFPRQKKGRPEAALRLIKFVVRSGEGRNRLASPKTRIAKTREAEQQHGPR